MQSHSSVTRSDACAFRSTSKERDQETGLDYFGARYYGSALGRWASPDLVNVTEERMVNPSNTLNKYVYGGNNPLKFVDPDGEDITLFYTNGGVGGHAMLLAYDQSNGNSAVQSFGPANHSDATELKLFVGMPVPGTATISATEAATIPPITLKKGRLVEVRIVDDSGVLVADGAKPKLLVGMWQDNGLFVTIPLKSQDKKGRVHAQYVPQDTPLQISVTSSEYTIKDSAGVAIDAKSGHPNQAEIPAGDQAITLTFQVTGRAR